MGGTEKKRRGGVMRFSPSPYTIRPLGTLEQAPSADRTSLLGALSVEIASNFSFNGIVSGPEPGGRYGDCRPLIGWALPLTEPTEPKEPKETFRDTHHFIGSYLLHLTNSYLTLP